MREQAMIRHALRVIEHYDASVPLHRQLAGYFRANKAMGSRDRREVRAIVYPYFRLGAALSNLAAEERLAIGNFLCSFQTSATLEELFHTFHIPPVELHKSIAEKLLLVVQKYPTFRQADLFPLLHLVSPQLDHSVFTQSMLQQPLVWIRVRAAYRSAVENDFQQVGFVYAVHPERPLSWSFDPSVKLTETESYRNGFFEIQDVSSQIAGDAFLPASGELWWDACAASGGKSLQLLEKQNDIKLLATDVRSAILENYRERLQRAGYTPEIAVADLTKDDFHPEKAFDAIIADVPCSGSGTWSRTPEMCTGFIEADVKQRFIPLQRQIISRLISRLKSGGTLYFITCSVFFAENEENIHWLVDAFDMKLVRNVYLKGMDQRADSMFLAVLVKN